MLSSAEADADAGANAGAILRCAVILRDPTRLSCEERRLLEYLCTDERFDLVAIAGRTPRKRKAADLLAVMMRLDGAVFARDLKFDAPAFDAARPSLHVADGPAQLLGASTAIDVLIDLAFDDEALREWRARIGGDGEWTNATYLQLSTYAPMAGVAETVTRRPVTGVTLTRYVVCRPDGETLATGVFNTKFSPALNNAYIREKSIDILLRELTRMARDERAERLATSERAPEPMLLETQTDARKALLAYPFVLADNVSRRVARVAAGSTGLSPARWTLRLFRGDVFDFDPSTGKEITPTGGSYWADPFLFEHNGDQYLFFEDYPYGSRRGYISVAKIGENGIDLIGLALQTPYHLSYPFVFRAGGDILMMPETNQARQIEVWRAVKFPTEWELVSVALEGHLCADSALFEHQGRWWLFTNMASGARQEHCSVLHLFAADSPLLTNLTPHPLNPVVVDSRTARGAGRVFRRGERVFRFSQYNAYGEYGVGANIMEIDRLDPENYRERLVRRISPSFDPTLMGAHHIDFSGDLIVMDVRHRAWGFARRFSELEMAPTPGSLSASTRAP
ncbi:MAG: hypothetical protein AAFX08_04050 [Pseudomonadota bacterium]